MFRNVSMTFDITTNSACRVLGTNELQLHIPITLNLPTASQQGGYQVASSYVEDLRARTKYS
jgi:hypothetical protein